MVADLLVAPEFGEKATHACTHRWPPLLPSRARAASVVVPPKGSLLASKDQVIGSQDSFTFLKIIEDPKGLLFMRDISINIYHVGN